MEEGDGGDLLEPPLEMATDLRIEFQDLAARWFDFPLPCDDVNGTLHLRTEGSVTDGRAVTSLELYGRSEGAKGQVRFVGRNESGPQGSDAARWELEIELLLNCEVPHPQTEIG